MPPVWATREGRCRGCRVEVGTGVPVGRHRGRHRGDGSRPVAPSERRCRHDHSSRGSRRRPGRPVPARCPTRSPSSAPSLAVTVGLVGVAAGRPAPARRGVRRLLGRRHRRRLGRAAAGSGDPGRRGPRHRERPGVHGRAVRRPGRPPARRRPVAVVFLLSFMVLDTMLSLAFLCWPILGPNDFHVVDRRVWLLNWSPPAKAANTAGVVGALAIGADAARAGVALARPRRQALVGAPGGRPARDARVGAGPAGPGVRPRVGVGSRSCRRQRRGLRRWCRRRARPRPWRSRWCWRWPSARPPASCSSSRPPAAGRAGWPGGSAAREDGRAARWAARIERRSLARSTGLPLVLASACLGLPPLAAVSLAAGASGQRRWDFGAACLGGRTVRFALLALPAAWAWG